MAIYHFSVKVVSRGKGQSAVAKAAYNSRERMTDERTGETHDYRKKGGLAFEGIFAPKDAPEWVHDREELYNEVERRENRRDAQLLREVEVGLPHELTEEQREWLVKDFVREQFVRKGMVADVAIHEPDPEGDQRNHHAHILLSMREIGPDGFGDKVRAWNGREQLEEWREAWERTANRYLERFGHEVRIDHRSLEEQGIDREPTRHQGPDIRQIEARGLVSEVEERREAEMAGQPYLIELAALRTEQAILAREETRLIQDLRREAGYEPSDVPERSGAEEISRVGGALAGQFLMGLARGVDGVFGFLGELGSGKTDPALVEARATNRAERAEAAHADWQRYLKDADYAAVVARHEAEEGAREEREEYQKRGRDDRSL